MCIGPAQSTNGEFEKLKQYLEESSRIERGPHGDRDHADVGASVLE